MRKIKWKRMDRCGRVCADVGSIVLECSRYTRQGKEGHVWLAEASMRRQCCTFRIGLYRSSLDDAKDDAVRMARELLLDYQTCLRVELKRFDLVE